MTTENLERRLAASLTDNAITSSMLAALVEEADAAIIASDKAAIEAAEAALDPCRSPDPKKARQMMEDSTFQANRLRTLAPRLKKRLAETAHAEAHARWLVTYEKAREKRDALASELAEFYPEFADKLIDLLQRARAVDVEVSKVNATEPIAVGAPYNGPGRLEPVECFARGVDGFNNPQTDSLDKGLKLPAFERPGSNIWPNGPAFI